MEGYDFSNTLHSNDAYSYRFVFNSNLVDQICPSVSGCLTMPFSFMSTVNVLNCLNVSLSLGADTTPFATQAEVTLKTNYFATRDMLTHFLPLVKPGGTAAKPHEAKSLFEDV